MLKDKQRQYQLLSEMSADDLIYCQARLRGDDHDQHEREAQEQGQKGHTLAHQVCDHSYFLRSEKG